MPVDDVSNNSASLGARSSDPIHTIITPPEVDLRQSSDEIDLASLEAELRRLAERVAALEAERERNHQPTATAASPATHPAPTHKAGAPTVRRRTRVERQNGWQPAKR